MNYRKKNAFTIKWIWKKLLGVVIIVVAVVGLVIFFCFLVGWWGRTAHSKAEWYTEALTTLHQFFHTLEKREERRARNSYSKLKLEC
jgi:hypothetical protein